MKSSKPETTLKKIRSFFSKKNTVARAIMATVLGIVFIIFHNFIGKGFVLVLGAALLIYAGYDIFKTLKPVLGKTGAVAPEKSEEVGENVIPEEATAEPDEPVNKLELQEILKKISLGDYLFLTVGLVFMIFPGFMMGIVVAICGVALIIMAGMQLKLCLSYKDYADDIHPALIWVGLAVPVVFMILSIFMIVNPFKTAGGLILFAGITLLLFGLVEIARIIWATQFMEEDDWDDETKLIEK